MGGNEASSSGIVVAFGMGGDQRGSHQHLLFWPNTSSELITLSHINSSWLASSSLSQPSHAGILAFHQLRLTQNIFDLVSGQRYLGNTHLHSRLLVTLYIPLYSGRFLNINLISIKYIETPACYGNYPNMCLASDSQVVGIAWGRPSWLPPSLNLENISGQYFGPWYIPSTPDPRWGKADWKSENVSQWVSKYWFSAWHV